MFGIFDADEAKWTGVELSSEFPTAFRFLAHCGVDRYFQQVPRKPEKMWALVVLSPLDFPTLAITSGRSTLTGYLAGRFFFPIKIIKNSYAHTWEKAGSPFPLAHSPRKVLEIVVYWDRLFAGVQAKRGLTEWTRYELPGGRSLGTKLVDSSQGWGEVVGSMI